MDYVRALPHIESGLRFLLPIIHPLFFPIPVPVPILTVSANRVV